MLAADTVSVSGSKAHTSRCQPGCAICPAVKHHLTRRPRAPSRPLNPIQSVFFRKHGSAAVVARGVWDMGSFQPHQRPLSSMDSPSAMLPSEQQVIQQLVLKENELAHAQMETMVAKVVQEAEGLPLDKCVEGVRACELGPQWYLPQGGLSAEQLVLGAAVHGVRVSDAAKHRLWAVAGPEAEQMNFLKRARLLWALQKQGQEEAARLVLAACLQHSPHSTTLLCGGQPAPPLLFTYCSLHHTLVLNAVANLWAGLPEPLHHTALAWAQQAATCMVRYQYDMRAMSDVAPAFLAALYRLGVQHKQLAHSVLARPDCTLRAAFLASLLFPVPDVSFVPGADAPIYQDYVKASAQLLEEGGAAVQRGEKEGQGTASASAPPSPTEAAPAADAATAAGPATEGVAWAPAAPAPLCPGRQAALVAATLLNLAQNGVVGAGTLAQDRCLQLVKLHATGALLQAEPQARQGGGSRERGGGGVHVDSDSYAYPTACLLLTLNAYMDPQDKALWDQHYQPAVKAVVLWGKGVLGRCREGDASGGWETGGRDRADLGTVVRELACLA